MTNEITALTNAITKYGTAFTDLVVGLSVGSEDLYRITPTALAADAGIGAGPDTILSYINQVKKAVSGTPFAKVPLGHVDTWTAWVNGSNAEVINAIDWLGVDSYPYFQNSDSNAITDAYSLFWQAYDATVGVAGGKEVWITETGWPIEGATENLAIASIANAKTYWQEVGCARAFDKISTWWYILQDAAPVAAVGVPGFGLVGSTLSTTPLFDLSCDGVVTSATGTAVASATGSASSGAASGTASASGSAASATATGVVSPSASSAGSEPASSTAAAASPSSTSAAAGTIASSSFGLAGAILAVLALL